MPPIPPHSTRRALKSIHHIHGAQVSTWTYPATGPCRGVILAVHGFRGDHHGLARVIGQLPDFAIVVPDLPGFGASTPFGADPAPASGVSATGAPTAASPAATPATPRHDVAGYGEVIGALREELGLGPDTILLGHSFGTIVAAAYLARHPGAFARLVLINPICEPALEGGQAVMSRAAGAYYAAGERLPAPLGEALLRSRLITDVMSLAMLKSRDPAMRAYVVDQHRRFFSGFTSRATLREAYAASITQTVRDVAARINEPTLLVVGEQDELGSVKAQRSLARTFPRASMRVIGGVGHLIHYEKPAEAASLIEDFLAAEHPWVPRGMPRTLYPSRDRPTAR
ncbi:alpha/beta hydrolase [Paeniglutamicibacter sp. ABSL32-1]|uniref:alpha/beta fold hydrolase n=1 Tax=Paeniglutamicibacter quisquiliarum TaxID=2849498 RepID=UPI001C2DB779|nr:alpha/beta hydrolase [Paeniglutamicibacter quisquiliarum]MBV1778443.1 alpha/beta hydrolase [Paeniglutamicibacter quisquiliarum]